ncbi:MAG: hypothetical protein RL183_1004, partial [Pseudomonadota bacterium]
VQAKSSVFGQFATYLSPIFVCFIDFSLLYVIDLNHIEMLMPRLRIRLSAI